MKIFTFILSFITILGISTLGSADPVAYYPFNSNANDVINGFNGTVNGAALTTDRLGNANSAYSFDGINDYIKIPEFLSHDTPAMTISAWVKPNGKFDQAIVYKGLQSGEIILRTNSSGTYDIGVKLSDETWFFAGGGEIDPGTWQFITGTYTKGDKIEMWVDGILENSVNISNLNLFNGYGAPALSSIGSYQQATSGFFNGIIDDVTVFNAALSGTEIQALADSVVITPNAPLVIHSMLGSTYSFDYWWNMGINPPPYQQGYMFDVLALQAGSGWQYIGQIDAYGNSSGWQTAMLHVPSGLQGHEVDLRFVLTDYSPQTNPIVYLRNLSSVPEPTTMLLLGLGLVGLAGMRSKIRK